MKIEPVILDQWYPVATEDAVQAGKVYSTQLLGQPIEYRLDENGELFATDSASGQPLQTLKKYYTCWVSLGKPGDIFELPEFAETDRRIVAAGSIRVHASGLRVVENFLDMAHFPFVHAGILGEQPYTVVKPYQVDIENDEIFARDCGFYQPKAALSNEGGLNIEYIYRVSSPFNAMLYKTCPMQPARMDVIGLFVQPCTEEWSIVHVPMAYLDDHASLKDLRLFQQTIFGQDITILSNHIPRKMPLLSSIETSSRADSVSVAYRRWLHEKGVRYGTWQEV
ncbi:MAG: aromatic ring-hydroxylating dioxygenase subunit alpha [Alcaligenaceae bacterium]|nr:aromatic ring-hydroxylating dioxygenase subunit alpha [Alcaligenaceae bacterium]